MDISQRSVPSRYEQPISGWTKRNTSGLHEKVDFIPRSNLRIWYNNQTEGYTPHHHDALEIIICKENSYTVIANNCTYNLNVGDILIIPPHMLHEILCDSYGVRFIFLVNMEFLNSFQDYKIFDSIFIEPYLCTASLRPDIYQQIYAAFMQMTDIYFSNNIFWEISIYSMLLKVLEDIGQDYFNKSSHDKKSLSGIKQRERYEDFSNLLQYIDDNYAEELTLEQAANYIGFSKYHFSRLFKQHTNMTFYDYLCHKRIQAAQSLLTTDIPITEIAFQTGFNNLTTFCRCFKKCANCSPTEYRNKFRHEEI